MRIDIHAHLRDGTLEEDKKDILSACQKLRLDKIAVSGIGSLVPDEEEIERLNSAVADFSAGHPGLVLGWCHVNPKNNNAAKVLEKGVQEQGMVGMKLWVATVCDDSRAVSLVQQCAAYGVPVLVHAFHKCGGVLPGESVGDNVARLARLVPQAVIIMAHLGGNCLRELKPVTGCPNVYADLSGSICRRGDIEYAVKKLGARRVLLGTDMPLFPGRLALGRLEGADLTLQDKKQIMGANACELLGKNFFHGRGAEYAKI